MEDLDAVTIETDEVYLTKYALAAAERGLHVHMDKPGGIELADFEKLIATAKKNNTIVHLGYMYRYNPYVQQMLEEAKRGEFGEIFSVEAQMSGHVSTDLREWMKTFPGGMMFFLGCHLIDMVVLLQGEPLEVIPYNTRTGTGGINSEDLGFAVLRYEKGVSFVKSCSAEENGFVRRQLVVCGTKGTYEIKPWEKKDPNSEMQISPTCMSLTESDREDFWADTTVKLDFEPEDRYDGMMQDFAEIVRGKENQYTLDHELTVFRTLMKACGL